MTMLVQLDLEIDEASGGIFSPSSQWPTLAQGHHLREEGPLQIGRNLFFRFGLYLRQQRLVGKATALAAENLKFTSSLLASSSLTLDNLLNLFEPQFPRL